LLSNVVTFENFDSPAKNECGFLTERVAELKRLSGKAASSVFVADAESRIW